MVIRFAKEDDASGIRAIYAQYIDSPITFETELPDEEEFRRRIRIFSEFYPYLVSEENGRITGYAYSHKAFTRSAYRFDVETSIYLDKEAQHTGTGMKLYSKLLGYLQKMNIVNAYALVTEPNRMSVYFHQKAGFREFAFFPDTGFKNGRWISVIWLAKTLNMKTNPPAEIRSIHEVLKEEGISF